MKHYLTFSYFSNNAENRKLYSKIIGSYSSINLNMYEYNILCSIAKQANRQGKNARVIIRNEEHDRIYSVWINSNLTLTLFNKNGKRIGMKLIQR